MKANIKNLVQVLRNQGFMVIEKYKPLYVAKGDWARIAIVKVDNETESLMRNFITKLSNQGEEFGLNQAEQHLIDSFSIEYREEKTEWLTVFYPTNWVTPTLM